MIKEAEKTSKKYKKTLDKIVWSFSTISLYEDCPRAFFIKKIEGIIGDTNAAAEIGSYGHDLNERLFKQRISAQEALDECVYEFDDHVTEYISETNKSKKYMALCEYLSEFDESIFDRFDVLEVEEKHVWMVGDYKFIGIVDLLLQEKATGKVYLIDHKSASHFLKKDGSPLKNMESAFKKYSKQMYLYADAIHQRHGRYPDYIVWNHFLDKGKTTVIPFEEKGVKEATDWVVDTINRIYKDTDFLPMQDYVRCNLLCDYRNGLCEYKELGEGEEE